MNASIRSREHLSFTKRDPEGRLINWPRNNPGVAADWQKGIDFFEGEVFELATRHRATQAGIGRSGATAPKEATHVTSHTLRRSV